MNRMKLGEILSVKHGWAFKGEYFAEDGERSILTPGNFFEKGGFKPNNGKERYYTGVYPKEYLCHKGDLIVAMTQQAEGLLGSTALVPENDKYLHNQRIGLITCDEKRLNKLFAYYLFMTKSVREQLERSSSGTKVKHTSPEKIYDVEVEIPDVISQQKIANLLWSVDEKIANNKAINDNLEQQLMLLYDYWFTQFDFPDNDGNPYQTSGGKMVWNEQLKRNIPENWKVQSVISNCLSSIIKPGVEIFNTKTYLATADVKGTSNLMGYEEEYNQSFEDNKIHINFVDSKENELVQLADNISSIYRKCFEKSFEAFRCNKQWTDNIWFTENYSRIINTIGMEHIKMDTQISDYVLPFVIRDIFGNEYGQFEQNKEKFWGLFYFYKERIMEDIDAIKVDLPL